MKILSVISILFLLFACGEGKKDDVIDMKDITPHSDRDYSQTKKDSVPTVDLGFDIKIADELGIQVIEINEIKDPMFPDRFSPKSNKKLALQLKKDQITFCQWVYKDSLKTMNALFNWLDCFGPKCKSIKYRFHEKFQPEHMLMFVNDTSITYISSPLALDANVWQQYLEKKNTIEEWDNVIIQKARKKSEWFNYSVEPGSNEKKFLPFKE